MFETEPCLVVDQSISTEIPAMTPRTHRPAPASALRVAAMPAVPGQGFRCERQGSQETALMGDSRNLILSA